MARKRQELWVGVFVTIGLCLLAGLIVWFGKLRRVGQSYYRLTAYFTSATGITPGTPVRHMGLPVGEVESLAIDKAKVKMILKIDRKCDIPVDAQLSTRIIGVMGDYYLEFDSGTPEAGLLPKDGSAPPIEGRPPAIDEIMDKLRDVVTALSDFATEEETWDKLKSGIETLSQAIDKTPGLVAAAQETTAEVRQLVGEVRGLVQEIAQLAQETRTFTANLDARVAEVGKDVAELARSLLANANQLQQSLEVLNSMLQRVEKIDEQQVLREVLVVLARGQQLIDEVENTVRYFRRYPGAFVWGVESPKGK